MDDRALEWAGLALRDRGWIVVGPLALLIAVLAFRRAASVRAADRTLWALIGVFLSCAALNAFFGFDRSIADAWRRLLVAAGAYGDHSHLQAVALIGACVVVALSIAALFRRGWRPSPAIRIPLGLAFALGLFLAARAVSLHQIDAVLNARFLGVSYSRAIEISLMLLLLLATARAPVPESS